jgi:hypothetical protein
MRKFIAATAIVVAGVGVAGVAGADPPADETYTCNGVATTFEVHGRMGILLRTGQKYLAHNIEVSGSFDPVAPGEPTQTFEDTQWTSGQTGGLQCSAHEVNVTDEGTETFDISFNALPIGRP